jgi:hypothetical protein
VIDWKEPIRLFLSSILLSCVLDRAPADDLEWVYDIGKPLVVEEIFPLRRSIEKVGNFVDVSRKFTDGLISFY